MIWKTFVGILIGCMLVSGNTAESEKELKYEIITETSWSRIPVTVTYYTSTVWECDDTPFICADGTRVGPHTLAVSPDLLNRVSFGDSVFVSGTGWFEVHDVMNPRWERRIDIWKPSKREIPRVGIHRAEVWFDFNKLEVVEWK